MKMTVTTEDAAALREARDRLETRIKELSEAAGRGAATAHGLSLREGQFNARLASLNPGDSESVAALAVEAGQIALLQSCFQRGQQVHAAADTVVAELRAIKPLITASAQSRCVEEGAASACAWISFLDRPRELFGLGDYVHQLSAVARGVSADLGTILAAKRPALLSENERITGCLRDGSTVIRRLAPEEKFAGRAFA